MTKALMHNTQIGVNLCLNVITCNDDNEHLSVIPLINLTWLIMAIWTFNQTVSRVKFNLVIMAQTIKRSVSFKVLTIAFISILWGVMTG